MARPASTRVNARMILINMIVCPLGATVRTGAGADQVRADDQPEGSNALGLAVPHTLSAVADEVISDDRSPLAGEAFAHSDGSVERL